MHAGQKGREHEKKEGTILEEEKKFAGSTQRAHTIKLICFPGGISTGVKKKKKKKGAN